MAGSGELENIAQENTSSYLNSSYYGLSDNLTTEAGDSKVVIILSSICYPLLLMGIFGNGSLIMLICTHRSMRRNAMNLYILNIAVADFIQNAVGLVDATQFLLERGWLLGNVLCKILRLTMVACLYVSIITLTAVAFERFGAVVHPIKAHTSFSRRRVRQIIGLTWITASLCASPIAIYNRAVPNNANTENEYCQAIWSDDRDENFYRRLVYKYLEFAIFFALPLLIQLVLYILIIKRLNKRQHHPISDSDADTADPHDTVAEKMRQNSKSRIQVVRMLTTCVVVYFISYLPIQILLFYQTAKRPSPDDIRLALVTLIILVYVNSTANPVIYYVCNKTYRTKLNYMWRCRGRHCVGRSLTASERLALSSGRRNSGPSGSRTTSSVRTTSLH